MKIFAIRDKAADRQEDLAYLFYYKTEKRFYIELPENADPWSTPLVLSSFAQKGITTINSYWSKIWVQQRILPVSQDTDGRIRNISKAKNIHDPLGKLKGIRCGLHSVLNCRKEISCKQKQLHRHLL
ncbi:MAG: hypothetical protein HUJ72_03555 [Blautia sp.]|nr:hypothetical protein [Blautia sp.]